MAKRHTTWERLFIAVQGLASGTENIQRRLYYATVSYTHLRAHEDRTRSRMPSSA